MSDSDRDALRRLCAVAAPDAELAIYAVVLPWSEGVYLKAQQVVCYAPEHKAE